MKYTVRSTSPHDEVAVSSTVYSAVASGAINTNATEANRSIPEIIPGRLRNLIIVVNDNATGGTTTVRMRKNAANANITLSITAAATGQFRDVTNEDWVAAGDLMAIQWTTTGAGSYGVYSMYSIVFEGQDAYLRTFSMGATARNANTTTYDLYPGQVSSSFHDTGNTKITDYGVIKNIRARVTANTVSATSTITSRKNNAAGNVSISVTASTTGTFSAVDVFDFVAPEDLYCLQTVTGATGTSMTFHYYSDIKLYSGANLLIWQNGSSMGFGTVQYIPAQGNAFTDTESFTPISYGCHMVAYGTTFRSFLNSANGISTLRSRKGERGTTLANGNISISVPASTTGWYADVSNHDVILPTDDFHYAMTVGGSSGTITPLGMSTKMDIISVNKTAKGFPGGIFRYPSTPNGISRSFGSGQ